MAVWVSTDFTLGKTIDNCIGEWYCYRWSGAELGKGDFFVIRGVILPQLLSRESHRFQVEKKKCQSEDVLKIAVIRSIKDWPRAGAAVQCWGD